MAKSHSGPGQQVPAVWRRDQEKTRAVKRQNIRAQSDLNCQRSRKHCQWLAGQGKGASGQNWNHGALSAATCCLKFAYEQAKTETPASTRLNLTPKSVAWSNVARKSWPKRPNGHRGCQWSVWTRFWPDLMDVVMRPGRHLARFTPRN